MKHTDKEDMFLRHIDQWTLFFHSEDVEARFCEATKTSMSPPKLILYGTYFGLTLHMLYRILSFASCFINIGLVHASALVEGILFGYLAASYIIESLLRIYNVFERIHGFFVYTALPIVLVTASFYTQLTPYFGAAYFIKLNSF